MAGLGLRVGVGPNGGPGSIVLQAETIRPGGGWRRLVLAVCSGLMLSASLPSLDLTPLAWIGLVPLLWAARSRSPRRAFGLGWLAGFAFYLATCWWIVYTIDHYTALPLPIAVGLLALMAAVLALYHGAFVAVVRWLELRRLPAVWLAPAVWVTLEWLRGWFFIGFPWAALGYSQHRFHDLVQMAEVTGVYGVSAVVVLFNVVVAKALRAQGAGARRLLPAMLVLTLVVAVLPALGRARAAQLAARPPAGTLVVGIAQGNVEQERKWDPAFQDETMNRYRLLTLEAAQARPAMIVWPETATPFFFQNPGPRRESVLEIAREAGVPLFFGAPAYRQRDDGRIEQLNRAYLVLPDGREAGSYDKMQLVPFGEYVPFARLLFFVEQVVDAVGQLGAGLVPTVFTLPDGTRFGALICYEGIFPALSREFVRRGAEVLVNVTNDAWYGRSSAPAQHLVQASFRAIENRVPMVRAANTGISAIVDPDGRIRWEGPLFEMAWHVEPVSWPGVRTFYTRFGDVFACGCALATLVAMGLGLRRKIH